MKSIMIAPLMIVIACILMAGCVGTIKNTTADLPNVSVTTTFMPFKNVTNVTNVSSVSNVTVNPGLNGTVRVSIGSWETDLPVYVDNQSVGMVRHDRPLDLILEEGNHTVKVCASTMCEEENVTVRFAKLRLVDFEERLIKDVEFPKPTARILSYYPSGSSISITVEFINPSVKDLVISGAVQCSYTYIETRSMNRVGNLAQSYVTASVKSGARVIQTVNLNVASGYSYDYSIPTISGITTR